MPAEREWRFVMPSSERPVEGGRLGIAQPSGFWRALSSDRRVQSWWATIFAGTIVPCRSGLLNSSASGAYDARRAGEPPMTTPSRHDVVNVGARCAGATLATFLARGGASVLLLDKDRLPSDQILSTHTIHPAGLDVLDEVGIGDAVRAVAPATHIVRLRKNDAFVDIEFRTAERSTVPADDGSTVSCRMPRHRLASRSATARA